MQFPLPTRQLSDSSICQVVQDVYEPCNHLYLHFIYYILSVMAENLMVDGEKTLSMVSSIWASCYARREGQIQQ